MKVQVVEFCNIWLTIPGPDDSRNKTDVGFPILVSVSCWVMCEVEIYIYSASACKGKDGFFELTQQGLI